VKEYRGLETQSLEPSSFVVPDGGCVMTLVMGGFGQREEMTVETTSHQVEEGVAC
jgi:hypothetical protein